MVKLNKIYTKTGDDGTTGLTNGSRVKKHDIRPEAYGTVDELNSVLGMIVSLYGSKSYPELSNDIMFNLIKRIQNDLFDLGADISNPFSKKTNGQELRIVEQQVEFLENFIDNFNKNLKPLNSFVLPGGSIISSWFHVARTITRRAERNVSNLSDKEKINKYSLMYLNRLSDLLFVISRSTNENGKRDVLWKPGKYQ